MRTLFVAAALLAVSIAVPTAGHADVANFTFTSDDCTGGCGTNGQGSTNNNFGSITVTTVGSNTLDFLVTLNSPMNFVGSGLDATFALALDKSGATFGAVTPSSFVACGTAGFCTVTGNLKMGGAGNFGDGTTSFGYGLDFSPNGGTSGITSIEFTLTLATGLTLADLRLGSGGSWFAADAASIAALGGTGNTGAIDGTVAVPAPILGAGLPGLIAACLGLVAFARRRRNSFA